MATTPDKSDVDGVVQHISSNIKYPIHNFTDLARALGGDQGSVTFHGKSLAVKELETRIPGYYFPIRSNRDLSVKIEDMLARHGYNLPPEKRAQKLTTRPAGLPPHPPSPTPDELRKKNP